MAFLASATCKLRFIDNKLKIPIYTHNKISAAGGDNRDVEVAIFSDGEAITTGPLSSVKVEVVVLPGDFSREDGSTAEEFDRQIVISRDGQGSAVLEGVCALRLVNGGCSFGNIRFREGSSRTRTRQFTLAARVDRNEDIGGLRVQEAVMDPVTVKDRRSEANEKSDPPNLNDEVYRLKGIAKNGPYCQRLQKENIRTVKDFLKAYYKDHEKLRDTLEIKSEKCKSWRTMTEHARECDLKDKHELKAYKVVGGNAVIFFNCVDDIAGAEFNGGYIAKEKFNPHQKALVDLQKIQAYNELNSIGLNSIGFDYVMVENLPIKISININVYGYPPFLMTDAVQQSNPSDQNAVDNLGPAGINHVPETIPAHANCSTAALIPGGGASDHPHDYLSNPFVSDGRPIPNYSTTAMEDDLSPLFGFESMLEAGTSPGAVLAASDRMVYSPLPTYCTMHFPPPTHHHMGTSGQDNFYFHGNNQFGALTTCTQNYYNPLPYQGLDYYPEGETESQGGGTVPVGNNVPPCIPLSAQDPAPKSTYISQGSDLGTSFTGSRRSAYYTNGLL